LNYSSTITLQLPWCLHYFESDGENTRAKFLFVIVTIYIHQKYEISGITYFYKVGTTYFLCHNEVNTLVQEMVTVQTYNGFLTLTLCCRSCIKICSFSTFLQYKLEFGDIQQGPARGRVFLHSFQQWMHPVNQNIAVSNAKQTYSNHGGGGGEGTGYVFLSEV
jgi:hypothetical protein